MVDTLPTPIASEVVSPLLRMGSPPHKRSKPNDDGKRAENLIEHSNKIEKDITKGEESNQTTYIVELQDSVELTDFIEKMQEKYRNENGESKVENIMEYEPTIFNGFSSESCP